MKLFLSKLQKVVLGKITNHKSQIINSQAGVTLLLAILILSSVLAISFSLATIMFIEVRSSGDLLKTEPALYAATGVGEQAFFNLERSVCTATSGNCSYTTNFANNVQMPNAPTILSTTTPIFVVKVKAGSTFDSTLNKYDFCNTNSGSSGCNYGKVIINYITTGSNGSNLYAYLCEYDPDPSHGTIYTTAPCTVTGTSQNYWKVPASDSVACPGYSQNFLLADGSGGLQLTSYISCASWTIDPARQQQLILTNPGSQGDIFVKITTFAPDGVTGKGLPFVGKTAVSINTQYASVGRKIQVIVPNGGSSSGNITNCASPANNVFNACYFNDKTLSNMVLNRTDAYPLVFNWGDGSPDPLVPVDNFSASWVGSFNFANGSHSFTMVNDDGARLYIDGALVIDKWFDQGPTTYTYTTNLSGTHTIRMEYYENGGGATAQLSWN